ncbi:radical SAM domain-containing protein [gut metagenome]|uniref:Radical SAM domain-containing protein n=1 Tax=gut metagenome TaxID=749906 RepID=J9CRD7_9ZZZZ
MEEEAAIFAFSVHIWNKPFVFRLIGMLKKLRPEAIVVVGGPEVAFAVERTFQEQPAIDYIVQGEGELCFAELLDAAENGSAVVPKHIAYVKNGAVELNGGTTVIEDMSILPFPYPDLEQVIAEHKIVYYECTRGCPFNCSYCLSGISRSVRKRPLELVLADLDRFVAAGAELVKFVDRTYNLDEKYFLPMMQHLAALDTKATFHLEIKADMLSDKVLDFLATVPKGRFQMEIGIQSTHKPTLKAINRQDNWDRLASNVKRLLSFKNMHIHVDLIAGLPYEGLQEFSKSFN